MGWRTCHPSLSPTLPHLRSPTRPLTPGPGGQLGPPEHTGWGPAGICVPSPDLCQTGIVISHLSKLPFPTRMLSLVLPETSCEPSLRVGWWRDHSPLGWASGSRGESALAGVFCKPFSFPACLRWRGNWGWGQVQQRGGCDLSFTAQDPGTLCLLGDRSTELSDRTRTRQNQSTSPTCIPVSPSVH